MGAQPSDLVSVIIPASNAAPWIDATLASVLAQTHPRREVIVVDDGSTDDTVARVAAGGEAVRLIRQRNAGVGAARNAGLRVAEGAFIAWLDHDDLWVPDKLTVQLAVARRHPGSGLIVSDGVEFEGARVLAPHLLPSWVRAEIDRAPGGEVTRDVYHTFLEGNAVTCPAQALIPRHVVLAIGPVATTPAEPEDWDYYLRISSRYPVTFHRHSLARWRYVPSGRSGPMDQRGFRWELMGARLLERHRRQRALRDPALVAAAVRTYVQRVAREAYYHGRLHDRASARRHLVALARIRPSLPVLGALLALHVPEPLAHRLWAGWRRIAGRRERR